MSRNIAVRGSIRKRVGDVLNNEQSRWYFFVNDAIALIIVSSVVLLVLETVPSIGGKYPDFFRTAEMCILAFFGAEYLLRLWTAESATRYARSFFGVIDALAIVPGLLAMLLPALFPYHTLGILRILRVLRILRTLRLVRFVLPTKRRAQMARDMASGIALFNIEIFLFAFVSVAVIAGSLMYAVESALPGTAFGSIPDGMWWAVVTMTTVGYGDLVPITATGKVIASFTMLSGLVFLALLVAVMGRTMQTILFGSPLDGSRRVE
jgi:voltage-gated potassium channel